MKVPMIGVKYCESAKVDTQDTVVRLVDTDGEPSKYCGDMVLTIVSILVNLSAC